MENRPVYPTRQPQRRQEGQEGQEGQGPLLKKQKMSTVAVDGGQEGPKLEKKLIYQRRKIAIFVGYCGVGYKGMQKNPGAKTIQGDLEEALFHAGGVPDHDRGCPKRYDWSMSARTDKRVSAVGQVVCGRFYVDPPGFIDRLNSILPPQIRIFGFKRVTDEFHARWFSDLRRYVYLIPVFALDPTSHRKRDSVLASLESGNELVKSSECSQRGRKVIGIMENQTFDSEGGSRESAVQSGISSTSGGSELKLKIKEKEQVITDSMANTDQIDGKYNQNEKSAKKSENENREVKVKVVESEFCFGSELKLKIKVEKQEITDSLANTDQIHGKYNQNKESAKKSENENREVKVVRSELCFGSELNLKIKVEEQVITDSLENTDQIDGNCNQNKESAKKSENENREVKVVKSEFCYGDKERERFNRILKNYEGTHNFENFVVRNKALEAADQRHIISFDAKTTVHVDGIEFVKCEVLGQTFMVRQIRKMIGLAIAVMRNAAPESLIQTAFQKKMEVNLPIAPDVGLYLDECFFTNYNKNLGDNLEKLSMEAYAEEAEIYKMKYIYPEIASTEHREDELCPQNLVMAVPIT